MRLVPGIGTMSSPWASAQAIAQLRLGAVPGGGIRPTLLDQRDVVREVVALIAGRPQAPSSAARSPALRMVPPSRPRPSGL